MAANGQIIADRLNASDFYYHVGSDVYFSNNGGVSFTLENIRAQRRRNGSESICHRRSLDRGFQWAFSFNQFRSRLHASESPLASTNGVMALGARAGQSMPAIYISGTISNFLGVYRSDDGGSTWTQLNNTSEQWGGLLQTMAADPNVFGRVYIGINGRGIIMGNPASSLPANWVDTDINTPGNPGWSTSSTTLSNGTTNKTGTSTAAATVLPASMTVTSLTDVTESTGEVFAQAVTASANGLHVGDLVTISGATPVLMTGLLPLHQSSIRQRSLISRRPDWRCARDHHRIHERSVQLRLRADQRQRGRFRGASQPDQCR